MLRVFALIASILLFFLIYWVLPNRKVPARAVLPTAIVIGVLWEVAKYLYVRMLPRLDFVSIYGPFQVSVGLMIWAFLSGLLLLAGAHFSATRYALSVAREEEREQQAHEEGRPQQERSGGAALGEEVAHGQPFDPPLRCHERGAVGESAARMNASQHPRDLFRRAAARDQQADRFRDARPGL